MSNKKKLIKNYLSTGLIQVTNNLLPLLTIPYIVRVVGPDYFGSISFSQSFTAYFTLVINYGFDLTSTREIATHRYDSKKLAQVFSDTFFAKVFLFILSSFFLFLLIFFSPKFKQIEVLLWSTYLINLGFVLFPNYVFQGLERMPKMAIFNLLTKIVFSILIFVFLREKSDFLVVGISNSFGQILAGFFALLYAIRFFKLKYSFNGFRKIFLLIQTGFPVFASMMAISLYTYTNIFILGLYAKNVDVGLFSASSKLITVCIGLIMTPINLTLFPHIGKLFLESKERAYGFLRKVILIVVTTTIFASIFVFLFSEEIILIAFGEKFINAVDSLKILSCLPIIIGLNSIFGLQMMINLKLDKSFLTVTIIGAIMCVLLNIILIPSFSYIGTSIAWVLTEIFIAVGFYLILHRKGFRLFKFN